MVFCLFFFKQKTAYDVRISDWSSDVCSSDLGSVAILGSPWKSVNLSSHRDAEQQHFGIGVGDLDRAPGLGRERGGEIRRGRARRIDRVVERAGKRGAQRSEEHTSELQSLMRIS